jgi:hypothetical protein
MQFLLLVAGVILLATNHWFAGQHIVGLILVIAFAIATIIQLVVANAVRKSIRAARREFRNSPRNRRGF